MAKINRRFFYHGTRRTFDHIRPNEIGLIHFSTNRLQAAEFAEYPRGFGWKADNGVGRIIEAHLLVERLFDPLDRATMISLMGQLDVVVAEAEEMSQSPWTRREASKWLEEGQWQMLELPSVLKAIRSVADGLVMFELGCRNVAVFDPAQVRILNPETAAVRARPRPR